MPFKPDLGDWWCAAFWVVMLAVLPVGADLALRACGLNTISYTTYRWCHHWPWLPLVGAAMAFGLWWHICCGLWPFWGD